MVVVVEVGVGESCEEAVWLVGCEAGGFEMD